MTLFENTGTSTRIWPRLTNPASATTLELAPGERVELSLDPTFDDPWLRPVHKTKREANKSIPSADPEAVVLSVKSKE